MGKGRGIALCCAVLAALLAPSGAAAAGWTEAQLPGPAAKVFLLGVSCPSKSLCVAAGTNNLIASSTDPTGGAGAWNFVYAGEGPAPKTNEWPAAFISGRQIQGISCPSVNLCVGVTDQGNIYTSTNPTGPASSWQVTQIDGPGRNTHLFGVSCPSVSLCVAVTGKRADEGKIVTSTDPTGGPSAWKQVELPGSYEFRGVSCGSPTLCVAVAADGRIATSTNPTGDASAWKAVGTPAGPGGLRAAFCLSTPLCLAGNVSGNLLTSTNPTAGESSWKSFNGGASVQITGAFCRSATECLAVDNNGDVLTSSNPTAGKGAWSLTNIVPFRETHTPTELEGNALFAASCPATDLCVLSGALGRIFTSADPFAAVPQPKAPGKKGKRRGPKRPHVKITKLRLPGLDRAGRPKGPVLIRFYAKGGARGYFCKVDAKRSKPCSSPEHVKLGVGKHRFRVRAVGSTGLKGPVEMEQFYVGRHCTRTPSGSKLCVR